MARLAALLVLLALTAQPCTIVEPIRIWSKKPGASSKLFAFERNGKVGFIDPTGKIVIEPNIEARVFAVGDFSNGLARIGEQGYIDESGRWAFQTQKKYLYDFSDGLARASAQNPDGTFIRIEQILDEQGNVVANFPIGRIRDFSSGLASYETEGKRTTRGLSAPGLKGFINRSGKLVIPAKFADVGTFKDGLAWAAVDGYCHLVSPRFGRLGSPTSGDMTSCGTPPPDADTPCKVGFIDGTGNFVIPPTFEAAMDFQESRAAVRINGRWGFIDQSGKLTIDPQFEQVLPFREGLAAVKQSGIWGFIDTEGNFVIPPRFKTVESLSESLAIAYIAEKPFYIDRTGASVLPGPYLEATPFVHGLAAVRFTQTHIEYINPTGKTVFAYDRQ